MPCLFEVHIKAQCLLQEAKESETFLLLLIWTRIINVLSKIYVLLSEIQHHSPRLTDNTAKDNQKAVTVTNLTTVLKGAGVEKAVHRNIFSFLKLDYCFRTILGSSKIAQKMQSFHIFPASPQPAERISPLEWCG